MPERIDITVPQWKLDQNPEKIDRLERTARFQETDRAPVIVDMQLWALIEGRGARFSEMTAGPIEHLRGQILNKKYRYETIHDDMPIETEKLTVELDFGAIRGVEFPMQVIFRGDDQPKTIHMLASLEEIDQLEVPHPYSGHNKMRIDWFRRMRQAAGDFDVRLNGEPIELRVTMNHAGGPIPSAFALCGSNLFLWMALDPERILHLMQIVTESHLNCIRYLDDVKGVGYDHPVWLGADTGEMVNRDFFRRFVVPFYTEVWKQFPGPRLYHMCGRINHILDIIRDEIKITRLDGFGFPTDPEKLANELSGRVELRGGPHPVLVHDGPVETIRETCESYIRTVGRHGGYTLSEGFGIMAGTPPEHIQAMLDASRRVGWIGAAP